MFVSSHHMSEMAMTAEHLIVVGRGRLIADTGVDEFVQSASKQSVRVRSPDMPRLVELVSGPQVTVDRIEPSVIDVHGLSAEEIGTLAAEHRIVLHELSPQSASLEEAFLELTRDSLEFHTDAPADGSPAPEPVA